MRERPRELAEHTVLCQGNVRKKKHFIVRMASQLAEGPYHAGFILSWVEQMSGLRKGDLKMGRTNLCGDCKPPDPDPGK